MNKLNILIVGHGFVGKAVEHGFSNDRTNITIVDPKYNTKIDDVKSNNYELIFVCVPTPMGKDGEIDLSAVNSTVSVLCETFPLSVVALKSTVVPDSVEKLSLEHKNFVYNPEFLTEKNANDDFVNPFVHVFGGDFSYTSRLESYYQVYSNCKPTQTKHVTAKTASFAKYSINSYLALKVVFWNQMKSLMETHGVNYSDVRDIFTIDPRIGYSHSVLPGHDGRYGTGSACFAKDIPALIRFSDNGLSILKEAWNVNCDIRNSYGELLPREKEQNIEFNKILP